VKRPSRDACQELLARQAEPAVPPFAWRIDGYPYPEESALELAELCLLTGRDLSAIATASLMLNLARRIADLEEAFEVHDSPRRSSRHPRPQSGVAQPSDGSGWI